MRRTIVRRDECGGETVRTLDCGHTQVEPLGGNGSAQRPGDSVYAFCRPCNAVHAQSRRKPQTEPPPVDTRTELQRLADEVERAYVYPPARCWSQADVAVRKLVLAARRHACAEVAP